MKKRLSISTLLSVLLVAGCASQSETPPPAPMPEPPQLIVNLSSDIGVTYADTQVANAMKVLNARIVREGQLPKLNFQLVNFTQATLPIEYQVQWTTADGSPLITSAAWQRTTLAGMQAKPISSVGKSIDAKHAQITVRLPVNVDIYVPTPDPAEKLCIERQVIDDFNARLAAGEMKW